MYRGFFFTRNIVSGNSHQRSEKVRNQSVICSPIYGAARVCHTKSSYMGQVGPLSDPTIYTVVRVEMNPYSLDTIDLTCIAMW